MTGFANIFTSLGSIWLELLREAVPRITRVADVFDAEFLIAARTGLKRQEATVGKACKIVLCAATAMVLP
jgi:hypothetical protein